MSKQERKNTAKTIADSAHKIWLAGLGAFAKAQAEGTRAFEQLMREGAALEQQTRKYTKSRLDEMRERFEKTTERLRKTGQSSMERMQALIDERVAKAVERMAIPTRDELDRLATEMAQLNQRVFNTSDTTTASKQKDTASTKRNSRKSAPKTAKKASKRTPAPAAKRSTKAAKKPSAKKR